MDSISASGGRFITMEDHLARSVQRNPPNGLRASQSLQSQHHQQAFNSVHMQNANNTFNSFIEDPNPQWQTEIASAYNEVTGVSPQNYHMTSVNSRQYQIAQQQAMKQRMMEQSKVSCCLPGLRIELLECLCIIGDVLILDNLFFNMIAVLNNCKCESYIHCRWLAIIN